MVPGRDHVNHFARIYDKQLQHSPKGTAPDDPAVIRKKLSKKTMIKMNLGETSSVRNVEGGGKGHLRREDCRCDKRVFSAVLATERGVNPSRHVATDAKKF